MISAEFSGDSFTVSGHSGYADEGRDIVCAAVSAMAMLVCNTITDVFGAGASVTVDESNNGISLLLMESDEASSKLITGFYNELVALEREYPENIKVN